MSEAQNTILDLDAMMDIQMDSIKDIPDFVKPPAGSYQLLVKDVTTEKYESKARPAANGQEAKPATKGARIRVTYEIQKTLELANAADLPVKDGSLFSETFMGTEQGLEFSKRTAKNVMNVTDLAGASMKDVIDGMKNVAFKAALTIRKTDDGFENVQIRPVHEAATE